VVLRNGVAIDAEVPDYSELDTVPNERRYTADQPSAAPSEPPSISESPQVLPNNVPDSVPGLTSGAQTAAASVKGKVYAVCIMQGMFEFVLQRSADLQTALCSNLLSRLHRHFCHDVQLVKP